MVHSSYGVHMMNYGVRTIIDISFCSPSLAERVKDWHVTHEINSSDHRLIQFFVEIDATYSVYRRNFKKCDRKKFRSLMVQDKNVRYL